MLEGRGYGHEKRDGRVETRIRVCEVVSQCEVEAHSTSVIRFCILGTVFLTYLLFPNDRFGLSSILKLLCHSMRWLWAISLQFCRRRYRIWACVKTRDSAVCFWSQSSVVSLEWHDRAHFSVAEAERLA